MAGDAFLVDDGFDFCVIVYRIIRQENKITCQSKDEPQNGQEKR
jgi:hypothetical protein